MALAYTRALLKLSGEALGGEKGSGLDFHTVEAFAQEIKSGHALGVHLALVVGGALAQEKKCAPALGGRRGRVGVGGTLPPGPPRDPGRDRPGLRRLHG